MSAMNRRTFMLADAALVAGTQHPIGTQKLKPRCGRKRSAAASLRWKSCPTVCRVGKIARAVLDHPLSIRAIPGRSRGQVLPTRRQAAVSSRMGKGARNFERVARAFRRLCPPYCCDRSIRAERALLELDLRRSDHLLPLFSLLDHKPVEIGRRARKNRGRQLGDPRSDLGIREPRIDLLVELIDDLDRRISGRCDPNPRARL